MNLTEILAELKTLGNEEHAPPDAEVTLKECLTELRRESPMRDFPKGTALTTESIEFMNADSALEMAIGADLANNWDQVKEKINEAVTQLNRVARRQLAPEAPGS